MTAPLTRTHLQTTRRIGTLSHINMQFIRFLTFAMFIASLGLLGCKDNKKNPKENNEREIVFDVPAISNKNARFNVVPNNNWALSSSDISNVNLANLAVMAKKMQHKFGMIGFPLGKGITRDVKALIYARTSLKDQTGKPINYLDLIHDNVRVVVYTLGLKAMVDRQERDMWGLSQAKEGPSGLGVFGNNVVLIDLFDEETRHFRGPQLVFSILAHEAMHLNIKRLVDGGEIAPQNMDEDLVEYNALLTSKHALLDVEHNDKAGLSPSTKKATNMLIAALNEQLVVRKKKAEQKFKVKIPLDQLYFIAK